MAEGKIDFKKIADQFVELLAYEGVAVDLVILYGSQARGTATADSDIDLVVISKDLGRFDPLERLEFLSRIAWKLDAPIEVIGYTPDEVRGREGRSIFWDEISSEGKVIYEAA